MQLHTARHHLLLNALVTLALSLRAAVGAPVAPAASALPIACVLSDRTLPGSDAAHVQVVAACLTQAGYAIRTITVAEAVQPDVLSPQRCALLALPQSRQLPVTLIPALTAYLKAGGNLIALGTPLGSTVLVPSASGQWVDPARLQAQSALLPPSRLLFDFPVALNLDAWQRTTSSPAAPTQREIEEVSAEGRTAGTLHVVIGDLNGWDTLMSPAIEQAFPAGNALTVFSARGGPRTRSLAVEWDERDGSRWIGVVPLSTQWRRYALAPSQFLPWTPPPARVGTAFQPENAVKVSFGLAYSHTGAVPGRHEYWRACS